MSNTVVPPEEWDWPVAEGEFALGDVPAQHGGVIRDARLVWQSHGELNPARDNVILYPCSYTATHEDQSWLIGPDAILDPRRWFVVIPNMFSNGLSSGAARTPDYPSLVTIRDNVNAQRRLLAEQFGIDRLAAVYGFSMGAIQAYHWAAQFPELVDRAIVVCGSARTAIHNKVFLSGLLRTLEAAPEHLGGGRFSTEPHAAVRAFAHIYAGWGLSQDFYRAQLYRTALGATDLDSFLKADWEDSFAQVAAADLYAQALSWYHADISDDPRYGGDLDAALVAIRARVLLLPGETDLYFRVADNAAELPHLGHGELRPIPSIWGHRAGSPATIPADFAFLRAAVRDWLD
jgi:homoserine O-acetyltransferase/O-succinyltransferase